MAPWPEQAEVYWAKAGGGDDDLRRAGAVGLIRDPATNQPEIAIEAISRVPFRAACRPASSANEVNVVATEFQLQASQATFQTRVPYRFVVANRGALAHEVMVMPRGERDHQAALAEIEEEDLGPGRTAVMELTFSRPGEYELACHLPGHYESGMVLPITVR